MDGSDSLGEDISTVQGYQAAGKHSAVKVCYWASNSLTEGRGCYKSKFYGIESHRCLQMSPAADSCNLHCRFCWREQNWEYADTPSDIDDPETVFHRSMDAQRSLMSGYGGDPRVDPVRFKEALEPRHVAISLTGEPTLYPALSRYIQMCHDNNMTTFLVTNGTHPDALRALSPLPTQLYVSVTAPNSEIFHRLTHPPEADAWDRLRESLRIIGGMDTRRVVRHTVVKGWNMALEEEYAELDGIARPDFIEVKGYAFMGRSRHRLGRDNVPTHDEIRAFSQRIARMTGYSVLDEAPEASVVLLTSGKRDRWLPGLGQASRTST